VDLETVLLYVLGIVLVLIGLAISIGLHELGHLWPAKRFGVYVSKYMIGFGPTIWSRRRGETEYGIKALPLGGYIAMSGMYPPEHAGERMRDSTTSFFDAAVQEAPPSEDPKRAFYLLPIWKRIVVMLGGPLMNLLLAVVCYAIVLCGFGIPQVTNLVGSVSTCIIPADEVRTECAPGDETAPAVAAGIEPGDRVLAINGAATTEWLDVAEAIRLHPDQPIELLVDRGGEQVSLTARPLLSQNYELGPDGDVVLDAAGEPRFVDVGVLGIRPAYENVRQSPLAVAPAVGENIAAVVGAIATLPARVWDLGVAMFGSEERDPNGLVGVVGIGRLAGEITSYEEASVADRASSIIGILGSLNVALFLFNLIPLIPLDGGHIFGALWEGLRRWFARIRNKPDPGPLDIQKLAPLTMVVTVLLVGLGAFVILADIIKPISIL